MNDVRRILTSPELRSRLPTAVRAKVGWLIYKLGHTALDTAVFNGVVIDLLDRSELTKQADARDRLWPLNDAESYELVTPLPSPSTPDRIASMNRSVHLREPFVCDVENVTLFGPDAIAKTDMGAIILETTEHGDETAHDGNCKRNLFWNLVAGYRNKETEPTPDNRIVCPLVDPWARSYFHWIVDALTKLQGVERYATETGTVPELVVPESLSSWMERSLVLAGYDRSDCILWDGNTRTFDRVVVPSIRREVDAPSIDALRWLSQRMKQNANPVDREWSSRVYISRRKARNRQVLNERGLVEQLEPLGFEKYVLETLSIDEQISLFSQADAVFGLHGAGFTNTMFAENVTVIELFGSTVFSTVYYHIASGLGFDYGAIQSPAVARDVAVDPDRVVKQLKQMLQ
jgi:capsular polysaccharide biosynthesis protein